MNTYAHIHELYFIFLISLPKQSEVPTNRARLTKNKTMHNGRNTKKAKNSFNYCLRTAASNGKLKLNIESNTVGH